MPPPLDSSWVCRSQGWLRVGKGCSWKPWAEVSHELWADCLEPCLQAENGSKADNMQTRQVTAFIGKYKEGETLWAGFSPLSCCYEKESKHSLVQRENPSPFVRLQDTPTLLWSSPLLRRVRRLLFHRGDTWGSEGEVTCPKSHREHRPRFSEWSQVFCLQITCVWAPRTELPGIKKQFAKKALGKVMMITVKMVWQLKKNSTNTGKGSGPEGGQEVGQPQGQLQWLG